MEQPSANKPEFPGSTPDISCVSLVFINNFIKHKSKHKHFSLLFVFYCPGPSPTCISILLIEGYICIRYLYCI